jgi:hypothetical protein
VTFISSCAIIPAREQALSPHRAYCAWWLLLCRSHVVDLAEGHVAALNHIFSSKEPYCDPINLGTGTGTSVLEMIKVGGMNLVPSTAYVWQLQMGTIQCRSPVLICSGPSQLSAVSEVACMHATTSAQAFEEASGRKCKYKIAPRRGGDATAVWAATETAEKVGVDAQHRCTYQRWQILPTWAVSGGMHDFLCDAWQAQRCG